MNQKELFVYRKVSQTGILSFYGHKYYVQEKGFKGIRVKILSQNEDQTLNIACDGLHGQLNAIAFPIEFKKK